LLLLYK